MRIVFTKQRKFKMKGGSILLSRGGPGAASSYESAEDYHSTTGRGLGLGLGGLGLYAGAGLTNLKQLAPKSLSAKPRNIKWV